MLNFWKTKSRATKPDLPDEAELIAYLDGELDPARHRHIQKLVESSWGVRVSLANLERDIETYMAASSYRLPEEIPPFEQVWKGIPASRRAGWLLSKKVSEFSKLSGLSGPMDLLRQTKLLGGLRLRVASSLALFCLLLLFFVRLSSVPPVSAKEVLQRAEYAETQRIHKVAAPVVYRKLQVRRKTHTSKQPEAVSWETWNDVSNSRFKERVVDQYGQWFIRDEEDPRPTRSNPPKQPSAAPILVELDQIFEINHIDRRQPLSPAAYEAWRRSIPQKTEEVVETKLIEGGKALALTTTSAQPFAVNEIMEAKLVIRTEDWHPVEQHLKVMRENGTADYELTETAFQVLALESLTPSIFADLTPAPPLPIATAPPLAPQPAPILLPSATELLAAEVEAHYALHRVKACLGEPIEVVRDSSGQIQVRGLAESPERNVELIAALKGIRWVKVNVQTVTEAARAASSSSQVSNPEDQPAARSSEQPVIAVRNSKLPIQDQLERYFLQLQGTTVLLDQDETGAVSIRQRIAELSTEAVSISEIALAEAWALRRLAEEYPRWRTDDHRPATRWLLEVMLRDHVTELRTQINRSRVLLETILSSFASENLAAAGSEKTGALGPSDSGGASEALHLFNTIEQIERLTAHLFGGADLPGGQQQEKEATRDLLAAFSQVDSDLKSLEAQIATEFPDARDLLTLKDRPK